MRQWRAHKHRVQQAGLRQVGDEVAFAREKGRIFNASDRSSYPALGVINCHSVSGALHPWQGVTLHLVEEQEHHVRDHACCDQTDH